MHKIVFGIFVFVTFAGSVSAAVTRHDWKVTSGNLDVAANWNTAPKFDVAESQLYFGTGTEATVPASTTLGAYQLWFYRGWSKFNLYAGSGGKLQLGAGGVRTQNDSSVGAPKYEIHPALELVADQNWAIYKDAGYVKVMGPISGDYTLTHTQNGILLFTKQNYTFKEYVVSSGVTKFAVADAWTAGLPIRFTAGSTGVFNLDKLNIVFADLDLSDAGAGAFGFTTDNMATRNLVVCTGAPKRAYTLFRGAFTLGAGLRWNPASADATFAFSDSANTTVGDVEVLNGTVCVTNGASLPSLGTIAVTGASSVFAVEADAGSVYASTLNLASGGKVRVPAGRTLAFKTVVKDGTSLPFGTYTKTSGWIDGDGSVSVAAISWDADAGADDTRLATAANWVGDVAPDCTSGTAIPSFATAGTRATWSGNAAFRGLLFGAAADFTLAALDSGTLALGDAGIDVTKGAAARVYTLDTPLALAAAQTWTVPQGDTIELRGEVTGSATWSKAGTGVLVVRATNDAFTGTFNLLGGTVDFYGRHGLRSTTGGRIEVDLSGAGQLKFHGGTIRDTIHITRSDASSGAVTYTLGAAGTTNVFEGCFDGWDCPQGFSVKAEDGGYLVFKNGLKGRGNTGFNHVRIDDVPIYLTDRVSLGYNSEVTFNVSSNKCGCNHILMGGNCRVNTTKPFALYDGLSAGDDSHTTRIQTTNTGNVLDMCGYDQGLRSLEIGPNALVVTSATHAVLHLTYYSDRSSNKYKNTSHVVFKGGAGLRYEGATGFDFTLAASSSTTGILAVATPPAVCKKAAGSLTIPTGTSWPNASRVDVSDGTLVIKHGEAWGRKTDVALSGNGKIQLDNATSQVCRWLAVNGVFRDAGVYGASDNTAVPEANRLACLTGAGQLVVRGTPGLTVFLR